MNPLETFWLPDREAALAQAGTVSPEAYARTRNHLDGAVTRLSPWITHGFVTLPELLELIRRRHRLAGRDKLVFEFAWREYFHHAWRHLGDGIFADRRAPPSPGPYALSMPGDVLTASTGVPVIDASVRRLYDTGYLHNHQRMWLASYVVHLRKVHWRAGAEWMLPHLLDGDLASNHLSWQWCAGTYTGKPYLFDAFNVARYAPALASPGTVLDRTYEALDQLARGRADVGPEKMRPDPLVPPPVHALPPQVAGEAVTAAQVAGRRVALVHPWSLRPQSDADLVIAVIHAPFHAARPWSARRWAFVTAGMAKVAERLWIGDLASLRPVLADATSVESEATLNPGYREGLAALGVRLQPPPRITPDPDRLHASFSAFWHAVSGGLDAR
jgi:deoxyribodipyrimidine photo-lyase